MALLIGLSVALLPGALPAEAVKVYLYNGLDEDRALAGFCDEPDPVFVGPKQAQECTIGNAQTYRLGLHEQEPATLDVTKEGDFSLTVPSAAGQVKLSGNLEANVVSVPENQIYYVFVWRLEEL